MQVSGAATVSSSALVLDAAWVLCKSCGAATVFLTRLAGAANILVRYLGEEGGKVPLAAAVSLCNPFNLVRSLWLHGAFKQTGPGQL